AESRPAVIFTGAAQSCAPPENVPTTKPYPALHMAKIVSSTAKSVLAPGWRRWKSTRRGSRKMASTAPVTLVIGTRSLGISPSGDGAKSGDGVPRSFSGMTGGTAWVAFIGCALFSPLVTSAECSRTAPMFQTDYLETQSREEIRLAAP